MTFYDSVINFGYGWKIYDEMTGKEIVRSKYVYGTELQAEIGAHEWLSDPEDNSVPNGEKD